MQVRLNCYCSVANPVRRVTSGKRKLKQLLLPVEQHRNIITYFLPEVSIIWWVLSCSILLALSAMFSASISGDSFESKESVALVFFDSSLLLLQAVSKEVTVKMANIFFIIFIFLNYSKYKSCFKINKQMPFVPCSSSVRCALPIAC